MQTSKKSNSSKEGYNQASLWKSQQKKNGSLVRKILFHIHLPQNLQAMVSFNYLIFASLFVRIPNDAIITVVQ